MLDEADQMLDLGFIHALRRIAKLVPRERQSLFFSATMPKSIAGLAEEYLDNPERVAVKPAATTAERVAQQVMFVSSGPEAAPARAYSARWCGKPRACLHAYQAWGRQGREAARP